MVLERLRGEREKTELREIERGEDYVVVKETTKLPLIT